MSIQSLSPENLIASLADLIAPKSSRYKSSLAPLVPRRAKKAGKAQSVSLFRAA